MHSQYSAWCSCGWSGEGHWLIHNHNHSSPAAFNTRDLSPTNAPLQHSSPALLHNNKAFPQHTHTHTSESQPPIHSKPVSRCGRCPDKNYYCVKHISKTHAKQKVESRDPLRRSWKREQREQCSSWVSRYWTNTRHATCQTHLSLRVTLAAILTYLDAVNENRGRIHLLVWQRLKKASTFLRSVHLPQRQHPHSLAVSNLNSMRYSRT